MSAHKFGRWTGARVLLASALLSACVSGPQRTARRELRFLDTETASRLRHAATVSEGSSAVAPVATLVVASTLVRAVPLIATVLKSEQRARELEEQLVECARLAEREVNASHFGNRSPTRQECGEELDVDGCDARITRAMLLGQEKHALALRCAREVLKQLWPAPFSIEQRYRYYPNANILETVSPQEEARLIAQGCTRELWRTIKPDIVLHANHDLLRAVLIIDFKFPCPDTNEPRWTQYGERSAYAGYSQGQLYKQALGGEAVMISPGTGVIP